MSVKPEISDNVETPIPDNEKKQVRRRVPLRDKEECTITLEDLQHLQLSRKQFKEIRQAKVGPTRTEKQLEHMKKMNEARELANQKARELAALKAKDKKDPKHIDLRKDKTQDGIVVKIAPARIRKPKPKPESESESESESDEEKPKRFQARKPKIEDPIEHKVNKLNQLNSIISANPYYAQIMASRGVRY